MKAKHYGFAHTTPDRIERLRPRYFTHLTSVDEYRKYRASVKGPIAVYDYVLTLRRAGLTVLDDRGSRFKSEPLIVSSKHLKNLPLYELSYVRLDPIKRELKQVPRSPVGELQAALYKVPKLNRTHVKNVAIAYIKGGNKEPTVALDSCKVMREAYAHLTEDNLETVAAQYGITSFDLSYVRSQK